MSHLLKRIFKNPKCKCGHRTNWEADVSAFGDERHIELNHYNPFKKPVFCADCYEKLAIKCPWCGGAIYPFEYITLYTPKDPNFQIPEGSVVYSQEPLLIVGCQSKNCASSGADYCGQWVGDHVERFESALEECMRTGKMVIRHF